MKSLLYRLYSNENFGIGLFIVVTILAFSFLMILFFGKRDKKSRDALGEIANIENVLDSKNDSLNSMVIENNESESALPKTELLMEEDKKEEMPTVLETEEKVEETLNPFEMPNLIEEEKEPVVSTEDLTEKTYDSLKEDIGASLNDSLNLDSFEPVKSDTIETIDEPVIKEEEVPSIFASAAVEEAKPEIPKPKPTFSNQFSSVYINKKEDIVPEKEPVEEIKPVKPDFELPKTLDLPKLNKNAASNDIIKPVANKEAGIDSIINSLEDESFTIDK